MRATFIKRLNLRSKVTRNPAWLSGKQKGKDIVIYISNLRFLKDLNPLSKHFLLSNCKKQVEGEYRFKGKEREGRLYGRWCEYFDNPYYCFETKQFIIGERASGLPSFMNEEKIQDLDDFLKVNILHASMKYKAWKFQSVLKKFSMAIMDMKFFASLISLICFELREWQINIKKYMRH